MRRLALATLAAVAITAPAFAAQPIAGRWTTQDRDAVIEIAPCGQALCGRIVRFLVAPPGGADQRDTNNRDPKLRARKLMGMAVLSGFKEDGEVWRGQIYDPKSGRTYRSVVQRQGGTLEVKGCLGPFCQTQTWRRAG